MVAADLGIDRVEFRRRISYREQRAALSDRHHAADRRQGRIRQRRLPASRSIAASKEIDWPKVSKLAGQADRRPYHGLGVGLLHRGRRRRPEGDRAAGGQRRRHHLGLYRARRRSGRASRRCSRRSPPTRWKCRSSASATSITARPPIVSDGYGAYHSRSTVMGGSAVLDAANNFTTRSVRRPPASGSAARRPTVKLDDGQGRSGPAASRSR